VLEAINQVQSSKRAEQVKRKMNRNVSSVVETTSNFKFKKTFQYTLLERLLNAY